MKMSMAPSKRASSGLIISLVQAGLDRHSQLSMGRDDHAVTERPLHANFTASSKQQAALKAAMAFEGMGRLSS